MPEAVLARSDEIIDVARGGTKPLDSSFLHTLFIAHLGATFLFENSAHCLEPSTGRTGHAIKRLTEAITICRIVGKTRRSRNVQIADVSIAKLKFALRESLRYINMIGEHVVFICNSQKAAGMRDEAESVCEISFSSLVETRPENIVI
jgi:hypothetical protein